MKPPVDIEILERKEAFKGRLIHVVVDRVHLATGEEVSREVVLHPSAVAILPVPADGRIILVRQYRHPVSAFLWEIPAGLIDPGEEPIESAKRELLEETGYEASEWERSYSFFTSPGFTNERITLYIARSLRQVSEPDPHEIEGIGSFSRSDLMAMIDASEITDAKTILAIISVQNDHD